MTFLFSLLTFKLAFWRLWKQSFSRAKTCKGEQTSTVNWFRCRSLGDLHDLQNKFFTINIHVWSNKVFVASLLQSLLNNWPKFVTLLSIQCESTVTQAMRFKDEPIILDLHFLSFVLVTHTHTHTNLFKFNHEFNHSTTKKFVLKLMTDSGICFVLGRLLANCNPLLITNYKLVT